MQPKTYLYYDTELESWSMQAYTLEEICTIPGVTDDTHICLPDGSRTITVAQAKQAYGDSDAFERGFEYRLIEHTVYKNYKLDIKSLENKLNVMARSGWRVVGFCAPDTRSALDVDDHNPLGTCIHGEDVRISGIVACLERKR